MRVLLKDLSPNTRYALQARSKADLRVSEWSTSFIFDTSSDVVAPATPQNITFVSSGTSFIAKWDKTTLNTDGSPCNDFAYYEINIMSGINSVTFKTNAERFDFPIELNKASFGSPSANLNFYVRSVDTVGNASSYSSVINAINAAPVAPTGFDVQGIPDGFIGKWVASTSDDLSGYQVYMSTGSSFTPSAANLVFSGSTTTFSTVNRLYGTSYYFKLCAVDAFGTQSSFVTFGPVAAVSVFTSDVTAPNTPTGLTVTPELYAPDNSLSNLNISWSAVTATDLFGYRIRYRSALDSSWKYVDVVGDTSTKILKVEGNTSYDVQIAAYDFSGNISAYSSVVTVTLSNTKPSRPAVPTLAGRIQSFGLVHTLETSTSTPSVKVYLETDVVALNVYYSASQIVNPTNSTQWTAGSPQKIQTIAVAKGAPVVVSAALTLPHRDDLAPYWIYVSAVDSAGLESDPSAGVSVSISSITGDYFQDASIMSAKIQDLAANKIIAGTGIINDLLVKSKLTIDSAGSIESSDYVSSSGNSGYRIDTTSITIKNGSISAKAIQIQNSQNIVQPIYAGFEFLPSVYVLRSVSGAANANAVLSVSGTTTTGVTSSITYGFAKYETSSLRLTCSSGTREFFMGNSSTSYNLTTQLPSKYIVSAWVYNNSASTASIVMKLSGASYTESQTTPVPSGVWTRISFLASPTTNTTILSFSISANSSWNIDAIQVEEQVGALSTPSAWKPPGLTNIDGAAIRTGSISSSQTLTVNGQIQPYWSINTNGAAQFGQAFVRGSLIVGPVTTGVDPDAGSSVIQSGNYLAGTRGWTIRSDGYAEFRDLAVNSIKINSLAKPLLNTVFTKLYDYMEDKSVWSSTGNVVHSNSDPGAYSANSSFAATGSATLSRDAGGTSGGIAFEPEALYQITARVRQTTGDPNVGGIYGVRVGVVGYDQDGHLCGVDGTETGTQYMVAADVEQLTIFDGISGDSAGWQSFTGYIKGRNVVGSAGAHTDMYDPAMVHENVRYIVPFVSLNIGNSIYIAQLDAFGVNIISGGAPTKVSTGRSGTRSITMEASNDDSLIDHAIRFYSGDVDEISPGAIGQFFDNNSSNQSALIISPGIENIADSGYSGGNIILRSKTKNSLYNSSFEDGVSSWSTSATTSIVWAETDGYSDSTSMQLNPTGAFTGTTKIYATKNVIIDDYPEMIGQSKFSFSAMVKANRSFTPRVQVDFYTADSSGVESLVGTATSTATTIAADTWQRISITLNYTGGIPDSASRFAITYYCNTGILSTDVFSLDDVQFEAGDLSDFKRAASSETYLNTDSTTVRGALVISTDGEKIFPREGGSIPYIISGQKEDFPANPLIIISNSSSNLLIGNVETDGSSFRSFSEFAVLDTVEGRAGGGFRAYSSADEITPGRVSIFNGENEEVLYTRDKSGDTVLDYGTTDLEAAGFIRQLGTHPWQSLSAYLVNGWAASSFNSAAPSYYINNGTVYLRGHLTGSVFTNVFSGLPAALRPSAPELCSTVIWGNSETKAVGFVANTDGTAGFVSGGGTPSGTYHLALNNISWPLTGGMVGAPSTPSATVPNPPSALGVAAYSSSNSTGVYKVTFKAPAANVSYCRIVWRTDRYPASYNDGNKINVAVAANQNVTYLLKNLPVNKTIYIKIWSSSSSNVFSATGVQISRYLLSSPIMINATSTATWRDEFGGKWRTDTDDPYQGEYSGYNDNYRGCWFYGTVIYDKLRSGGVVRVPTKTLMRMKRRNTSHGSVGDSNVNIYGHGNASRPAGQPATVGGTSGVAITKLARGEEQNISIPSAWSYALAGGTIKGFMIYATSSSEYLIAEGKSIAAATGQLTIYHNG